MIPTNLEVKFNEKELYLKVSWDDMGNSAQVYKVFKNKELYKSLSPELIEKLDSHLGSTGIDFRIEWYPGTKHGFVFPDRDGIYVQDAAERHWERLFAMWKRQLS